MFTFSDFPKTAYIYFSFNEQIPVCPKSLNYPHSLSVTLFSIKDLAIYVSIASYHSQTFASKQGHDAYSVSTEEAFLPRVTEQIGSHFNQ